MKTTKEMIQKLMKDYNNYSELVALNYEKKREGNCDEGTLQWNRGHLYCIEDYLKALAEDMNLSLAWKCEEHTLNYGDVERKLTYRTISLSQ